MDAASHSCIRYKNHTFITQALSLCKNLIISSTLLIQINRKLKRIVLLLVGLVFIYPGTGYSNQVRIAAIFSQTGIAATHNEPLISMVQLAVEDINRTGGLLHNPVQLILLDNQSTPIGANIASKEAINMNVTAVIGAHWSSHSLIMAPLLQQAGIPMISPGSTNPEITKIGNYIFRACFLDSFQGRIMSKFAISDLNAKTAAIIRNIDEAYSVQLADFFSRSFKDQGGIITQDSSYRGKAVDFKSIVLTVLENPPDVIYLPGYTRDSGLFIKQARQMGVAATFLGGDAWDEIDQVAGEAIDGSFQSAPWHPDSPSPKTKYLKKLYNQRFHKPITSISAPLAYDAVHLLGNAIEKAGSTNKEKIRAALADISGFQGVTGNIDFDKNGDPKNKDMIIIKFEKKRALYHKTIKAGDHE